MYLTDDFFLVLMYVKLIFWHDINNRLANLMLAAEVQLFRLGIPHWQLNCHSQWRVKLIDCTQFAATLVYSSSLTIVILSGLESKDILKWFRATFVVGPLVFHVVFTTCFTQGLMLIARRIGLLNMVLKKLLARETTIVMINEIEDNKMKLKFKYFD